MKRTIVITLLFLLFLCIVAPIAAKADWYSDGSWLAPWYWHYNSQPRYVGEKYESSFEDVAARAETGIEYPPPQVFRIEAESVEDAETQLEQAMEYAPETVVISFTKTADSVRFYELYSEYRANHNRIDAVIGAVWTRRETLYSIGRSGTSVIISIDRYAEGWLCYVDTSPVIRIYRDLDYSRMLSNYRRSITGYDYAKLATLISETVDYDWNEYDKMMANGGYVEDELSHSVRGAIKGKAVCDGHASLYQFALACNGIKSFEVIERGDMNHAYNLVLVDGKWIKVDVLHVKHSGAVLAWIRDIYMGVA